MPVNRSCILCSLSLHFLLTFSLLNSLQGQVCTNLYYGKSYTSRGNGVIQFFFSLTDGNFIIGGMVNSKIMLIKINPNGDTLWNKRYDCNSSITGTTMKALQGRDGNIYCIANNSCLLKLDINGNLLAANNIFAVIGAGYIFNDMEVLNSGDLVLLLSRSPGGYAGNYLLCMKADASAIVWTKWFTGSYADYKDITIDGDTILIAGTQNRRGHLLAYNPTNGYLKGCEFDLNNQNIILDKVYKYDSGYLVHGYASGNQYTVRINKYMLAVNAYSITNIPYDAPVSYAVEPDGSYYLEHGNNTPRLLHVSKNDVLLWSKINNAIRIENSCVLLRTNQGLMASSGLNLSTAWWFSVFKADLNGDAGSCSSPNYPLTLVSAAIQYIGATAATGINNDLQLQSATATMIPEMVTIVTSCLTPKQCSSVTIAGPTAVCGNAVVNFKAIRNSGCSLPVEWKIEGAATTDKQMLNDSMLTITFQQNGNYRLIASLTGSCRSIADTVNLPVTVNTSASINLGADTLLCPNNTIKLNAGNGFATYKWQDNSTNSFYTVTLPGKYFVEATDACNNTYYDTVIVNAAQSPAGFLPADTSLCSYSKLELKTATSYQSYNWSTGEHSNKIIVSKPGLYSLIVTNAAGCEGEDDIRIMAKDCLEGFFVPNSFSPNGDGRNEVFKPTLLGNVVSYRFSIYNRWGQQIFETNDLQKGWNGLLAGKTQFNTNFVWVCRYQLEGQPARIEKGFVIPVQ